MSIKRVGKKGIFWCDFRTSDGQRVRYSLHTTDKKEARELEAKLISDADARIKRVRKGGLTLAEAFAHALRVRESWRSAKSLYSIKGTYAQVESYFGAIRRLSELDDETLLAYGEHLKQSGKTPSTINKRLSVISVLFEEALKWKKYQGPRPTTVRYKVDNGRTRIITSGEEAQVLAILRSSNRLLWVAMADLVTVLADTGLRVSEALNLEAGHINLDAHSLLVTKTKSGGDRVVPLTERSLVILSERARDRAKLLFDPLNGDTANRIWARVREKMGLADDEEFVIHTLRHTFATTLANAGIDSFRLQSVMGHKSLASTQRYVRISSEAVAGLSQIIEERTRTSKNTVLPEDKQEETPKE